MMIQGSCHCGKFRYSATTRTPYPYMRCYCTICRKTAGGGGYGINIMADANTLSLEGDHSPPYFQARIRDDSGPPEGRVSPARRHLCDRCGTFLYVADPRWPDAIYPFAASVDSKLPSPPGDGTHHAGLQEPLGYCAGGAGKPSFSALPRGGHSRLASTPRPAGIGRLTTGYMRLGY